MEDCAGLVDDLMGSAGMSTGSVVVPENLASRAGEARRGRRLLGVNPGDKGAALDFRPEVEGLKQRRQLPMRDHNGCGPCHDTMNVRRT